MNVPIVHLIKASLPTVYSTYVGHSVLALPWIPHCILYNVLFQEITKTTWDERTWDIINHIPFFSSENATFFYENSLFTLWLFNHIMKNTYTLSYKTKTLQINFYFLLFTNIQTWFCESYLSSKTPIWIFVDEQFLLPQHWWSKWEHFQLIHRPSNFQTQNRCHHIWYSDLVSKYISIRKG